MLDINLLRFHTGAQIYKTRNVLFFIINHSIYFIAFITQIYK